MKSIVVALMIIATSLCFGQKIPKDLIKLNISIVNKGDKKVLAANFINQPHWHTYWINPGDAGLPVHGSFKLDNKKIKLTSFEYPKPHKFIEDGGIITFGFLDDYSLFYELPKDIEDRTIETHFKWLVCKNICIPGEIKISGKIENGIFITSENQHQENVSQAELSKLIDDLPVVRPSPSYLDMNLIKYKNGLALITSINSKTKNHNKQVNLLTAYSLDPFSFKHEEVYKDKKGQLYSRLNIDWDGEYMEPELTLPLDGKFEKDYKMRFLFSDPTNGETYIIQKSFSAFNLNEANFTSFFKTLKRVDTNLPPGNDHREEKVTQKEETNTYNSLIYFALMAFIGGLILNIMPCVLPVISIKLFGLIEHSKESRISILKHNLSYSLGVMMTFMGLAGVIAMLKSTGEDVGWGFQLQSPIFVAIMLTIIFFMALNLFGLFEFRTPGGSKLGNIDIKDSFMGDFISGVLATILSTPCSAPFLGTALTFAFSESIATIFIIFTFIGLGLSSPFILTGFFPALIRFLPKPGMWMEHVKKILGFTLILTTIWLLDVFSALTDSSLALMQMNTALALLFFMFYTRAKISKNYLFSFIILIPGLILFVKAAQTQPLPNSTTTSSIIREKQRSGLDWQAWSEEKMNNFKNNGQLTFIDFTAKWCITCKVNEKLVLDTDSFKELVNQRDIKLLLGDWTKRDPIIGKWLKENGFVGVPAYFVINSKGELLKLGETISLSKLKKVLQ